MKETVLRNGVSIPLVGLGANGIWGNENERYSKLAMAQYDIYCYAMQNNKCRLFDTSGAYGFNEEILGSALKEVGNRKNIKLISKVSNSAQRKGNIRKALEDSLRKLGIDYLDLYLIHWPQTGTFIDTYLQMEKLYEEGLIKGIGVCNFHRHHIEELMQKASIVPMVNQIELHPLFTQDSLVNYCYAKDIQIMAYSPIARMHDVLMKSKPIYDLSKKHNCSPVQIILRWHYQLNYIAIPRTTNITHFEEFLAITDFELETKEIAWINSLNDNIRLRYNPDNCDFTRL